MSRLVKVVSTTAGTSIKEVQSAATTWGGLKTDLAAAGIDVEGLGATVRETNNSLVLDGAELPEGMFHLYLAPTKVKSGTAKDYTSMVVSELQDLCRELGVSPAGAKPELLNKVSSYYTGVAAAQGDETVTNSIKEIVAITRTFLNKLTLHVEEAEGLTEEDTETLEDFKSFLNQ